MDKAARETARDEKPGRLTLRQAIDALASANSDNARLRARVSELEAAQEWRPIERAPKDGTPILVCRHDQTFGWVRGWTRWESCRGIEGWISNGFFEVPGCLGLAAPTYWQILPAPPV